MSTREAPAQYKQPSRKGKRAWRKNINVTEVESGLDSVREELTLGGLINEKNAEDLFSVDATGSDAIKAAYAKSHKPTKVDEILARRSAVPAIESHKRSRISDGVIESSSKRRRPNAVSHRELERLKTFANGPATIAQHVVSAQHSPKRDIWEPLSNDDRYKNDLTFLDKKQVFKAPKTLANPPVSLLAAKNPLPAVPRPKPATSYNPVFHSWDEALTEIGLREVEVEKERLRDADVEQQRQERIAAIEEEGIEYLTEEESAWEAFESENEQVHEQSRPESRPRRKTQAERNKINRRKEEERRQKVVAKEKKKTRQAQNIKSIIKKSKLESQQRIGKVSGGMSTLPDEADEKELRKKRLGKHRIPEQPLEIVLPEELQDSLRRLRPEGNLLRDRFRNVQIRGLLETRKGIQQPKKVRRTYTEKWTSKDWVLPP